MSTWSRATTGPRGVNVEGLVNRRPRTTPVVHRVAAGPTFVHGQPSDDAALTCVDGWQGTVGEWEAHGGHVWRPRNMETPGPVYDMPAARLISRIVL